MLKYQVVINRNLSEVISLVNEFLSNGWSLQGGIAIAQEENSVCWNVLYAQAVVKDDKTEVSNG